MTETWKEEKQIIAGEGSIGLDHPLAIVDGEWFYLDASFSMWNEEEQEIAG